MEKKLDKQKNTLEQSFNSVMQGVQKKIDRRVDSIEENSTQMQDDMDTIKSKSFKQPSARKEEIPKESPETKKLEVKITTLERDFEDLNYKVSKLDRKIASG